jgi:hypothetical protein
MKKLSMVFLLVVFSIAKVNAQFGNVWLFSNGLKMDFNNDTMIFTPAQVSGSSPLGNSVFCDSSGNLLYYSDGRSVMDPNFISILNGDTLGGCSVAFQGALFLPHPLNLNLIYLFTMDANWLQFSINCNGNQSLSWALIDKTLNGGQGSVITKQNILLSPAKEKLTATRHCNGVDWWVLAHQWGNNSFYSFKVTASGIDTIPVISSVGATYHDLEDTVFYTASKGDLRISPNGKIVTSILAGANYFELLEFNNETGEVFNPFFKFHSPPDSIFQEGISPQCCTFSKQSNKMYVTMSNENSLYQYDVSQFDSLAIQNSKRIIYEDSIFFRSSWAAQLAEDGKVYFVSYNNDNNQFFIDEIVFPELPFPACQASYFKQSMNPTGLSYVHINHFPNFPDCIFARDHTASLHIPTCSGTDSAIVVFDTLLNVVHDITWDFGDPASGVNNTYEGTDPFHLFTAPGTYTITLNFTNRCNQFVISRDVFIPNTTPPAVPSLFLNAAFLEASNASNYQWYLNDSLLVGATDFIYAPNQNGIFSVSTTQNGCTVFSLPFQLTAVAIAQMSKVNSFSLMQSNEILTLQCNPVTECFSLVELIDLQGRVLQTYAYQQKQSKVEINIGDLQSGVYLLRVNGRAVRKVVKG